MTNAIIFDIIVCVTRKYLCDSAAMAQLVEHILGKDEVPGPNPGSSSRQPRSKSFGALVFYRLLLHFYGCTQHIRGCLELLLSLRSALSRAKRRKPVRIPRSEIGELALQAQSEGIFALRIPGQSFGALVFYRLLLHF